MRRGLALLVTIGVLGLLGVLASAFVTLARLERQASLQRVHATKALLLARCGIEDALARLSAGQEPEAPGSRFLGEDFDASGTLNGCEVASEVLHAGVLDRDACPASQALRPSFYVRDHASLSDPPLPALFSVEGRLRGISGGLPGTGDFIQHVSSPGRIFVNGGDPALPATDGYNAVLRRILGTLAEALDREDGLDDGLPCDEGAGWALLDLRPSGGWTRLKEVLASVPAAAPLLPYLTTSSWTDLKVIAPTPKPVLLAMDGAEYMTWADIRLGRNNVRTNPTAPVTRTAPDFERIGGRIVGRAPVDLAWARNRRPVLIALLAGLKGLRLDESTAQDASAGNMIGHLRSVEIANTWSPSDDCHRVADALMAWTTELRTWAGFDAFCDGLALTGTTDEALAKRDLLKAHFNPNSDLNKFNPDASLFRRVDKSDLLQYSTEFSLLPRGGGRLEAAGRVVDAGGRLLAERAVSTEAAPDALLRLTTQGEFAAKDLGRLELAGDEVSFRSPGDTPYVTPSYGSDPTFGHAFLGGGGLALQTAPEPHTVALPASWDGQVRLATIESVTASSMLFLARWDDRLEASWSAASGSLAVDPDILQAPVPNSLWHPSLPGTLHPDGLYVEQDRQPGYDAPGNQARSRGCLSFWVKPNYDVNAVPPGNGLGGMLEGEGGTGGGGGGSPLATITPRRHIYFNNTRHDGNPGNTACFYIGNIDQGLSSGPHVFSFFWENQRSASYDLEHEQTRASASRPIPPHRWLLLAFHWEMQPPGGGTASMPGDLSSRVLVNRGLAPDERNTPALYSYGLTIAGPATNFKDQPGLPARLHLGRRGIAGTVVPHTTYGAPDATFDELAIYDFGPDPVQAIASAETRTLARFEAGRYYKESAYTGPGDPSNRAGEWFSAVLDLGDVRLERLAWTQVVPRDLRGPAGAVPEAGDPGPDGRILLELVAPSGTAYAKDAGGQPLGERLDRDSGHALGRRPASPFRLHAVFQPNLESPEGTAILDALALDDLTLTYRPLSGPRLTAWD